jgi:serine phosphatase RsbU (regulator of sigma subunit)
MDPKGYNSGKHPSGAAMSSSQTGSGTHGRTPLPLELKPHPNLDLHAHYFSSRTGGDFFDAVNLGSHIIVLLTDIAGTKEQAEPIAAEVQEVFRREGAKLFQLRDTNLMDGTAQLVQETNHGLMRAAHGVRFSPTFIGCYDLALGLFAYVNAGGLTAVFHDSEGTRSLLNVAMPMGLFTHLTYEPSMQAFEPGAKLLLVTKGIVETQREKTYFGADKVQGVLHSAQTDSAAEICQITLHAANDFKKTPKGGLRNLQFWREDVVEEDLTALVMVRPRSR